MLKTRVEIYKEINIYIKKLLKKDLSYCIIVVRERMDDKNGYFRKNNPAE